MRTVWRNAKHHTRDACAPRSYPPIVGRPLVKQRLVRTAFLMTRDSNTHSNGIDQIVADQAGSDCERKLGPRRRQKPILFIGRAAVHGVTQAVDKTCCDCQHDKKSEPAARRVEKYCS